MAWIYLAESEDSPSHSVNGLFQSPTVNKISMRKPSCFHECKKDCFLGLQSGTTCELLEQAVYPVELQLISYVEVFLARTSVLRDLAKAWTESEVVYSTKLSDLQRKLVRRLFSSKTSQQLELADFEKLSEPLPIYGMTVGGLVFLPQKLEPRISVKDGFSWPTPRANDAEKRGDFDETNPRNGLPAAVKRWPTPKASDFRNDGVEATKRRMKKYSTCNLNVAVKLWPTPRASEAGREPASPKDRSNKTLLCERVGGQLNPTWVEWLMGYPSEWTALEPWVIAWYGRRPKKHLKG